VYYCNESALNIKVLIGANYMTQHKSRLATYIRRVLDVKTINKNLYWCPR
jgi:hypothetical protein